MKGLILLSGLYCKYVAGASKASSKLNLAQMGKQLAWLCSEVKST